MAFQRKINQPTVFILYFCIQAGSEADGKENGTRESGTGRRKKNKTQKRRAAEAARLIKQPLVDAAFFEGNAEKSVHARNPIKLDLN